jgi:hypothetical protein
MGLVVEERGEGVQAASDKRPVFVRTDKRAGATVDWSHSDSRASVEPHARARESSVNISPISRHTLELALTSCTSGHDAVTQVEWQSRVNVL